MIITTFKVMVPPENLQELIQTIESLRNSISNQHGFLDLHLYLEAGPKSLDETEVCLIEEWETPADFSDHRRTNDFAVLLGAFNLLRGPLEMKLGVFSPVRIESVATAWGKMGERNRGVQVETQ